MENKPLTQEEASKFNEIVSKMSREEKDNTLSAIKASVGNGRDSIIRNVINKK